MAPDQIFVCVLAGLALMFFVMEKIPNDLVALGILFAVLVVPIKGWSPADPWTLGQPIIEAHQVSLLGAIFANSGLLTVAFMFIVAAAIERTGLMDQLGRLFARIAGDSPLSILLALAAIVIPLSAFLNNTGVVLIFLPVIIALCRKKHMAPSRFLIPLSYFAIVGGLCTMIGTSTNIIANEALATAGLRRLSMFEITGLGLSLSVLCVLYLVVVGQRLLPERTSLAALLDEEDGREFLTAAIVSDASPLVGKLLSETPLAKNRSMRLVEVRRAGNRIETPLNELRFAAGDRLILKTHVSGVVSIEAIAGLENAAKSELGLEYAKTEKATLMEGMIGPQSRFVGRTLKNLNFRNQFGVIILAVHRHGVNLREHFENVQLEFGDTLLIEGNPERMRKLFEERNLVNLTAPKVNDVRHHKAWIALLSLLLIVVGGCFEALPFQWVTLAAALLVTYGGCLKPTEAYESLDWRILAMLLGMLGLSAAMKETKADVWIVRNALGFIDGWELKWQISFWLALAIIFTELMSNNAVAALLAPLAITFCLDHGIDYHPFIVSIMMGASIGFAMPTGYQTHLMVYGAGGYHSKDFIKVGLPLDILVWAAGTVLIPLFFC